MFTDVSEERIDSIFELEKKAKKKKKTEHRSDAYLVGFFFDLKMEAVRILKRTTRHHIPEISS
jgi:hypothetical protein